ncbi:MAG TPA: IclR family transcriptional regulator [bacterium]|nr:IclR family transcriptional regulator [bacterium]
MARENVTGKGKRGPLMLRSVTNALMLLSLFSVERPEWSLTELARELGLGMSTVFRLLATLQANDFVRRSPDTGRYTVGLRLWEIGWASLAQTGLRELTSRFLAKLVDHTGETAYCSVLDGRHVVHIDVHVPSQPIRLHAYVGDRFAAHCVASGKAILAFSPPIVAETYIAGGLARHTERTVTDPDQLRAQLAEIRRRGYSQNRGEWEDNVRGAAAPVWDYEGRVIAALAVAGPAFRLSTDADLARLGEVVCAVAEEMSRALGASRRVPDDGRASDIS